MYIYNYNQYLNYLMIQSDKLNIDEKTLLETIDRISS